MRHSTKTTVLAVNYPDLYSCLFFFLLFIVLIVLWSFIYLKPCSIVLVHLQQLCGICCCCCNKIFYVSMHLMGAPLCRAELSCAQLLHIAFCFFARERESKFFSSAHCPFCTICHAWNIFMFIATCISAFAVYRTGGLTANNDIFWRRKKNIWKTHKANRYFSLV